MDGLKKYFDSKKALSALLACLLLGIFHVLGVPSDQGLYLVSPLLAHIGMQGVVDTAKSIKGK